MMNRRFYFVLMLALLLALACASAALAETVYAYNDDGAYVDIYLLVDDEEIIDTIPNFSSVEIISKEPDGWAYIQYNGKNIIRGYVPFNHLFYDSKALLRYDGSAIKYSSEARDVKNVETMYVTTKDGDPLNIRKKPLINAETLLGSLSNHSRVGVVSIDSTGWAKVLFKTADTDEVVVAYASCLYLSYDKQGLHRSEKAAAPLPSEVPKPQTADHSLEELNEELKTAKAVEESFSVVVRPSRATGRVNLRWAPLNKSRSIVTYPSNKELTVLAETNNWYQVIDPEQGYVGFISKKLVAVVSADQEE